MSEYSFNPGRAGPVIGLLVLSLVVGVFLGWLGRGVLMAPHDALTVAKYGDWRLTCPPRAKEGGACLLSQDVVDQKAQAIVVRIALLHRDAKPVIQIMVPYNVLLPSGIGLHVGDAPVKTVAYKTCDNGGCVGEIDSDSALFDSVLQASQLSVEVSDLSGKAVTTTVSTKGLHDAASAMRDADSKRHSWLRRAFL